MLCKLFFTLVTYSRVIHFFLNKCVRLLLKNFVITRKAIIFDKRKQVFVYYQHMFVCFVLGKISVIPCFLIPIFLNYLIAIFSYAIEIITFIFRFINKLANCEKLMVSWNEDNLNFLKEMLLKELIISKVPFLSLTRDI